MDLGAYLAEARKRPWAWGEHDCCAFPARWVGAELPGYASEAEAEALLHAAGGLVPLFDCAAEGVAEPVDTPEPGDVGVIELPAPSDVPAADLHLVELGAIWTGKRWVFVPGAGGIAGVSAPTVLKVWRPLCRS